jgi:hypothetical protein
LLGKFDCFNQERFMKRYLMIPMLMCVGLAMAACQQGCTTNPIKAADGPDEQAYAVLGTYHVFQKQALKIVQDATLPANIRSAAANADAVAFPVLKTLDESLTAFLDAKAALDAGVGTEAKVGVAVTNLKKWTTEGRKAVDDFKKAVQDARKAIKPVASTVTPFHRLTLRSV